MAASRLGLFAFFEIGTYGFTGHPGVLAPFRKVADRERRQKLGHDPELLAKATPDYQIGCKRVLFTSDWYPTLLRDDVELVTGPVQRVTRDAVVGGDGVERPTDTIIYGTGFETHNFVAPMEVHGLDGKELNAVWGERAEAYLGTTVSGFPNMFVLYGPEHQPRLGIGPLHARVAVQLRDRRVPPAARRGLPLDRPAARDPGGVAGGDGAPQRRHRLDDRRLRQLVRERAGREHQQLARPLARVPSAHPAAEPRRLPRRRLTPAAARRCG